MNRITKWITLLAGSALIAAAALGAVVVVGLTNASAQVETSKISSDVEYSVDDPEEQHWPGGRKPGGRGPGGRRPGGAPGGGQELADALGIPLEDLQEAQQAARLQAAEIALEAGDITQEQYDRMEAMQAFKDYFDMASVTEEILGTSIDELKEAHAEGKRMPEILEELGLEASDLRDAIQSAFNEAVQEALDDGLIDEEMAEQMLDKAPGGRGFGTSPENAAGSMEWARNRETPK